MLFDLRGRGRRRVVQGMYLFLAILIGGGLILFGVGTGGGQGGLLNAINNGAGSSSYVSQQAKNAAKQTKLHPNDPGAWSNLVQTSLNDSNSGFNTATKTYNKAGLASLSTADRAWQRYLALAKNANSDLALRMAEAYDLQSNFKQELQAWQIVADANPTIANYWLYVALSAYKIKNKTIGDLASAKAISLEPKTQRATLKTELDQARSGQTSTAPSSATSTTVTVTPNAPSTKPSKAKSSTGKAKK